MGYKVIIQDSAIQDLDEIAFYIAKNLQEPQTALKVVRDIRDVIDGLKTMPERYKLVDDEFLAVRGIRVAQSRKYLIFYTELSDSAVRTPLEQVKGCSRGRRYRCCKSGRPS